MTTLDTSVPAPQVYTNATQDDLIWRKDTPPPSEDKAFGWSQREFSPPLKHITIQSTLELLESFDPIDVLDSASEKSVSSTDTTIMMTTEEERRNAEKIKISLRDHELRKSLQDTNLKYLKLGDQNINQKRGVPNNYMSCQQMFDNAKFSRDKSSLNGDEGYSTDSRSNTTASISSPLSSSLSSLSTFEGSPYSGSVNSNLSGQLSYSNAVINSNNTNNFNMQRGPIQKGPNLHVNSRASAYKHGGLAVKRRETQTDTQDSASNLEERLRALTTIEEEDSGLSTSDRVTSRNGMGRFGVVTDSRNQQNLVSSPRGMSHGKRTVENPQYGGGSNYDSTVHTGATGFFRAVPVSVVATEPPSGVRGYSEGGYYQPGDRAGSGDAHINKGLLVGGASSPSPHANGDGWKDYTRFFEKDTEIPLHNIDPAGRGKFSHFGVDDVPDMDINRQIGTGSPAHPRKHRFSFNREGDRMVLTPGVSESALTHVGQRNLSEQPEVSNRSVSGVPGNGYFRADEGMGNGGGSGNSSNSNGRGFSHTARQHHVMSSMPDLRLQDPAWVPGPVTRNPHPNYQAYPPHPYQQQQQQHDNQQMQQHQHHHQYQQQQRQQPHFSGHPGNVYPFCDQQKQYPQFMQPSVSNPYLNHPPDEAHSLNMYNPPSSLPQGSDRGDFSQSYPEVVLRRSRLTASARAAPNRPDRSSWHPASSTDQQHLGELDRLHHMGPDNRSSLDLGSIPQLQKQIRATSELCLQASRRHMFASSADIYKLFSGQKKPPVPPPPSSKGSAAEGSFSNESRNQSSRHSFHSVPTSTWQTSTHITPSVQPAQDSPRTKPKLRVLMPSMSTTGLASPGPIRADHNINIPPEAWTSVTSLPVSAESEMDRLSFQRQSHPLPVPPDVDRLAYQRPGSASAELGLDRYSFQRQSSGYSSENELQQIESNARAAKKLQKRQGKEPPIDHSGPEFIPLNRSIDDSNTDNGDDLTDNEPVYVNQSMLTRARTFDALNKPSGTEWETQVSIPAAHRLQEQQQTYPMRIPDSSTSSSTYNANPTLGSSNVHTTTATHSSSIICSSNSNISGYPYRSNVSPFSENITQHQVINFNTKPITITSHVPSPYSFQDQLSNHSSNNSYVDNKNSNNNNNFSSYPPNPRNYKGGTAPLKGYEDQGSSDFHNDPASHREKHSPHLLNPSGAFPSQTEQAPSFSQGAQPPHPRRSDSNSSAQLSPVEIAQILDVPFATNIISDEQGERLSTLV